MLDEPTKTKVEAAVFQRLLEHLQNHNEVQNIDLMVLASFCRNCLSKWYLSAARDQGVEIDYDAAREMVYGMPYSEWKERYQSEATPEQLAAYQAHQEKRKKQ